MAKGKIKPIIAPWSDITIERHGCSLTLTPVEMGRGSKNEAGIVTKGKYLGLKATADLDIGTLEDWTAKEALPVFTPLAPDAVAKLSPELKEAYQKSEESYRTSVEFRATMFLARVCDSFNEEFSSIWRTVCEDYSPDSSLLTEEQKTSIINEVTTEINDWLAGERKEREHDASYYRRAAKKVLDELAKKVKGWSKPYTADQLAILTTAKTEKDRLIALAEAKEAEEMQSIDDILASL